MSNLTISIDDDLLKSGRQYAKKHHTSLNALIRKLLQETVTQNRQNWLDDCFDLMDESGANSHGKKWYRGELYDV